jgi:TPR repeat protein
MDTIAPEPYVLLALAALDSGDHDTAFVQLQVYAERGDVLAQHTLAWCYEQGVGCEKDLVIALHWWKQAAKGGFAESQFAVGHYYEHGKGVEKDLLAAASWYGLAEDRHAEAAEAFARVGRQLAEK